MSDLLIFLIKYFFLKVKTWFQNRRMKYKKQLRKTGDSKKSEKSTSIKETSINIKLPINNGKYTL